MVQLRVPNLVRDDGADVLHVAVEVRDEGVVDDDALGAEEADCVCSSLDALLQHQKAPRNRITKLWLRNSDLPLQVHVAAGPSELHRERDQAACFELHTS